MRQQADEQRAAAQRQLAGTLGALHATGPQGHAAAAGGPPGARAAAMAGPNAEALRRMHIQQAMAARQAGECGGIRP